MVKSPKSSLKKGKHLADSAQPPVASPPSFGLHDSQWSEDEWLALLTQLVRDDVVNWKDVTALTLGHLNPSQVGTSLASSAGFKRRYGKGKTMRVVLEWIYSQDGRCADCGSRLELQADHKVEKKSYADPLDADFIENMVLRCRRCNVVKRPSHEFGGVTYLTAESALMWILFVIRPRTLSDFKRLCRLYGMTMSDIRMQEAWAMAHWLSRSVPPAYSIADDATGQYDLILWPDAAITRVDPGFGIPPTAKRIHTDVPASSCLGFITQQPDGRLRFHEQPVAFVPFSTYDLGAREPQSLAIGYSPPNRRSKIAQRILGLPPRGCTLIAHAVRKPNERFELKSTAEDESAAELPESRVQGIILKTSLAPMYCRLEAIIPD